jgi:hypothetical protein
MSDMRTGLLIADLEMSFTTSFQHTARVKWNVPFNSSNVKDIIDKLQQLKENIQTGNYNDVHVGHELTVEDVERVQNLLFKVLQRYKEQTTIPAPPKLYTFLNRLREMETQSTTDAAKEIVRELFAPKPAPQQTKKAKKQADIEALKQQRVLDMIRKQNKNC